MALLWFVPIIIVLVLLLVLAVLAMNALRRRQVALRQDAVTGQVESLRYPVPVGQDPAAVVAALKLAGYEAVRDDAAVDTQELIILCPAGADRERAKIRAVIAHDAPIDMEGHPMPEHEVRFLDELHGLG